jgi:hypothetical protein
MESSLFALEKSKITFKEIKGFCDQQLSEGLRIEYKKDFPANNGLARTICAFANTAGGMILIGVEADKKRNIPIDTIGIQITEGLQEKVVNICLNNILPRVVPEIKLCPFKQGSSPERGVLFVRVSPSYNPPHYLWQTKEILIRADNKNERADLQNIEDMIERRKGTRSNFDSSSTSTSWSTKSITLPGPAFETVVIFLNFAKKDIVPFNKEIDSVLFEMANEILKLQDQTPNPNHLIFDSRNPQGQITRFCRIDGDGRMVFQRSANVKNNILAAFDSFIFLTKSLRAARKICSYLAFYGDVSVGLTIINSNYRDHKLELGFPEKRRLPDTFSCEWETISVSRTIRYDDFENLSETLQSMFNEFCRYFHFAPDSETIKEIVEESFIPLLKLGSH